MLKQVCSKCGETLEDSGICSWCHYGQRDRRIFMTIMLIMTSVAFLAACYYIAL